MADPTTTDFLAIYDDFVGFSRPQVQHFLDAAIARCPETAWTEPIKRQDAILALTAHHLELKRRGQAAAAATATGVAAGSSSQPSADTATLSSTVHGARFEELRSLLPTRTGFTF